MVQYISSLRFSLEEGTPYYQQLMEQIRHGIVSGELSVGDKLPSSRFLASSLGVSRSTTSRAYEQLIAEGLLLSEEKRGVFVAALPMVRQDSPKKALHGFYATKKTIKAFDAGADVLAFPNKAWATSMRRSWMTPDPAVLQGDYTTGYPVLKEAIVDYLYRVRGLKCVAEQVIVTAGNRDSLVLLQHAIASLEQAEELSSKWWVEDPTFTPIREAISAHLLAGTLNIDDEGPRLPDHEWASNVAIVTPNRQYPLGVSISTARRQQWLQRLLQDSPRWWLVEDDYDNEFVYQGRSLVPFMQTANMYEQACDRVFFVGSFSKIMFRGLRLGFIVVPLTHINVFQQSQQALGSSASLPLQPALADFMWQGHFERHINRMRRHYRQKRDALLVLLEHYLSPWFDWKKPRGGMHVLVELKPECIVRTQCPQLFDQMIARDFFAKGIRLSPLSQHYLDEQNLSERQGFLFGFSGLEEEDMTYIVRELHYYMVGKLGK